MSCLISKGLLRRQIAKGRSQIIMSSRWYLAWAFEFVNRRPSSPCNTLYFRGRTRSHEGFNAPCSRNKPITMEWPLTHDSDVTLRVSMCGREDLLEAQPPSRLLGNKLDPLSSLLPNLSSRQDLNTKWLISNSMAFVISKKKRKKTKRTCGCVNAKDQGPVAFAVETSLGAKFRLLVPSFDADDDERCWISPVLGNQVRAWASVRPLADGLYRSPVLRIFHARITIICGNVNEAENAVPTVMLGPHRDTCDGDESKVETLGCVSNFTEVCKTGTIIKAAGYGDCKM